jgi:hypothetical protein
MKAIISNPGEVTVVTGQKMLVGWVAFLNGPVVVWSGQISDIPETIPGEYTMIWIHPSDYEQLFGALPKPVPVEGIPEATMLSADEINKQDAEDAAKLHASFNRVVSTLEEDKVEEK